MEEDVPNPGDSSIQMGHTFSASIHGGDPIAGAPLPVPERRPEAVGFLLSQLGFEVSSRFGKLMAEVDLEPRQFALMRAIDASEGQSQNAMGEWLRIPASSMVALIDHLEERGLVERRRHPTDRRSRTLHMTSEGNDLLAAATALAMGLEMTICEGFEGTDRAQMLELLAQVADNLGLVQGVHPGATTEHGSPHVTEGSS
jgi:DNA-binding MarR family transcriptional regulator